MCPGCFVHAFPFGHLNLMTEAGTPSNFANGHPALTLSEYDAQVALCRALFADKMHDYGTAWRVLRPSSLTDQIFIKAQRIRTLQEGGERKALVNVLSQSGDGQRYFSWRFENGLLPHRTPTATLWCRNPHPLR